MPIQPLNGPLQGPLPTMASGYQYVGLPFGYPYGAAGSMPYIYAAPPQFGTSTQPVNLVYGQNTSMEVNQNDEKVKATESKEGSAVNVITESTSSGTDAGLDLLVSFAQQQIPSAASLNSSVHYSRADANTNCTAPGVSHDNCAICAEFQSVSALGSSSAVSFNDARHLLVTGNVLESVEPKKNIFRETRHRFGPNWTGAGFYEERRSLSYGGSVSLFGRSRPLKGSISQRLDKHISVLLDELEKSKDLNIQLQDELLTAEQELNSLRCISKSRDAEIRSQATGKLAVMVQEIYRAQKERDVAMMNRINQANAERDEALLRLKRLQQKHSEFTSKKGSSVEEMKLDEIITSLRNVTSSDNIDHRGAEIVEAINHMKEERRQIAAEEMRAILEERDLAEARCKDLDAELKQMRMTISDEEANRQHRQVLQGKLFATEHERNLALEKISKMEEEMLSLRVYYNLHGSLSQEVDLYQQFSQTLDGIEQQLKAKKTEVDTMRKDREQLLEQTKVVAEEKMQLMEELAKSEIQQQALQANNEKLQRLVNVLRRKINGLSSS